MSKILVNEMPFLDFDCPFGENHYDVNNSMTICKFSCSRCPGPDKCVYLTPCRIPMHPNAYQQACLRTESAAPDLGNNQYARILQG